MGKPLPEVLPTKAVLPFVYTSQRSLAQSGEWPMAGSDEGRTNLSQVLRSQLQGAGPTLFCSGSGLFAGPGRTLAGVLPVCRDFDGFVSRT